MTDSFKPKAGAKKTNHDDDQCGPYSQRDNYGSFVHVARRRPQRFIKSSDLDYW